MKINAISVPCKFIKSYAAVNIRGSLKFPGRLYSKTKLTDNPT